MAELEIKKLNELIESHCKKGQTVSDTNITRLTALGENYGSLMLKVDVILKNVDDSKENLHLVAKCLTDVEFFKNMFQVSIVKNEIAFYTEVIPTLQDFQREHGVDDLIECFPKLYASRLNLKSDSDEVDDDAVILLENVNLQGYQHIDRLVGFCLEDAKLVLKDLATLHAVSLALRLQKPKLFEKKIKEYCMQYDPPPTPPDNVGKIFLSILEDDKECKPYFSEYKKLCKMDKIFALPKIPTEPFISFSHNDLWANNTMQKFEEGKAVSNKFIDFQRYSCDSPARDLTFFLWSSCQFNVLKDHIDELISYYHQQFIRNLESVNCGTEPFSFDNFLQELHTVTKGEVMHSTFVTIFIACRKHNEAFISDEFMNVFTKDDVPEEAKHRISFMVKYYGKRGWLQ